MEFPFPCRFVLLYLPVQPALGVRERPPSEYGKPRLLVRVRAALRVRHYSRATEKAYVGWIRRYVLFHGKRHPLEMGEPDVKNFLTDLAVRHRVSPSTQNQALAALLFLYREVLDEPIPRLGDMVRAKRSPRLPVVLTRDEVEVVLWRLHGTPWLVAMLLYGAGLRLMECLRLRIKDVEFATERIIVRQGKGGKDRVTLLPETVKEDLTRHMAIVRAQHDKDIARGWGRVELPDSLARKYPNAGRDWGWQWVFPAFRTHVAREDQSRRRHHMHQTVIQRAFREAVLREGIEKLATPHTLRHSFATHLLEDGYDGSGNSWDTVMCARR